MFNLNAITNENNVNIIKWLFNPDKPYRILLIGGSGSGKTKCIT